MPAPNVFAIWCLFGAGYLLAISGCGRAERGTGNSPQSPTSLESGPTTEEIRQFSDPTTAEIREWVMEPFRYHAERPSFFSDGKLAFGDSTTANIYEVSIDGGDFKRMIGGPSREGYPAISPDGQTIIYTIMRGNANTGQIFKRLVHPDEGHSEPVPLTNSSRVSRPAPYDYEIWSAKADGTDLRQVTRNQSINEFPRFSTDGKWIVFFSNSRREGPYSLWRVRPDGSELGRLPLRDLAK